MVENKKFVSTGVPVPIAIRAFQSGVQAAAESPAAESICIAPGAESAQRYPEAVMSNRLFYRRKADFPHPKTGIPMLILL